MRQLLLGTSNLHIRLPFHSAVRNNGQIEIISPYILPTAFPISSHLISQPRSFPPLHFYTPAKARLHLACRSRLQDRLSRNPAPPPAFSPHIRGLRWRDFTCAHHTSHGARGLDPALPLNRGSFGCDTRQLRVPLQLRRW